NVRGEPGAWLSAQRNWLQDSRAVVDAAILNQNHGLGLKSEAPVPYHPPEQPRPQSLPEQPQTDFEPLSRPTLCNGLEVALTRHHVQYEIVHEDQPLDAYRLLVLQGDAVINAAVADRIRSWVANGGCLLAEYHAGLRDDGRRRRTDFTLAGVLGVRVDGYGGSWGVNYLQIVVEPLRAGLPRVPLMVVGPAVRVV